LILNGAGSVVQVVAGGVVVSSDGSACGGRSALAVSVRSSMPSLNHQTAMPPQWIGKP